MSENLRSFKSLIDHSLTMGEPSETQLKRINSGLTTKVTASDLFVFPSYASNRKEDSFHSIMDDTSLRNYAQDYDNGCPFLRAHDAQDFPLGFTFESTFDQKSGRTLVWTYITRGLKLNSQVASDDFIRGVETGVIRDVSIRFKGGWDRCNICNERLYSKTCRHIPGEEYDGQVCTYQIINARAKELSAVSLGSNPEAGIIRKVRMLWTSKLLDDKQLTAISHHLHYNVRAAIEGEEYLKFSFEQDDEEHGGSGDMIDAAQGQSVDASKTHYNKVDPVTGAVAPPAKPQQKAKTNISTIGESDRGSKLAYTDEEIKGFQSYYTRALAENGANMPSELKVQVRDFLDYLELTDEERATKVVEPPSLKANSHIHKHSHGNEVHEHEHTHTYGPMDDHSHSHHGEGSYSEPKPNESQVRHFVPESGITFTKYLRQRVAERAALKSASNPVESGQGGTAFGAAKQIPTLTGGIEAPGEGGHTASDNMIMPGQEPIQDVSYKGFSVVDGEPIGNNANIQQNTSMDIPGLEISPEGVVKWILGSQSAVMGEAGLDGVVPRSEPDNFEQKYVPIRLRFDQPEQVRELLMMAGDGVLYRQQLLDDLVRFGCLVEEDKFDKDFHLRIADRLNTSELARMVNGYMHRVNDKYKTNENEQLTLREFPEVSRRQTLGPINPANKEEPVAANTHYEPLQRADLFKD